MRSAKVSELKASLSRYLARVKRGEEVVVTERGQPIAKLVPLSPREAIADSRLDELERSGVIRRGGGELPADFWKRARPSDSPGVVLGTLLEDREQEE